MNPTSLINSWIAKMGSERDTINVLLCKLQAAYAWIIAQEKCPECYGDLIPEDSDEANPVPVFYSCEDCGKGWFTIGTERD